MNCCCWCEYGFKCCGAPAFELGLLLLSWAPWWLHPQVLLLMQTLRIHHLLSLSWCHLVSTRVQVNSSSRFFSPVRQGLHANAVGALELHGSVQLKEGLPDSHNTLTRVFTIINMKTDHWKLLTKKFDFLKPCLQFPTNDPHILAWKKHPRKHPSIFHQRQ